MIAYRLAGIIAAAVAIAGTANADEPPGLRAGAGSPRRATAPAVTTLQRTADNDGESQPVCFGWRRWAYSAVPVYPSVAYAPPAPAYYSSPSYPAAAPETAPPPVLGPATYYHPTARSPESVAAATSARPTIVLGYQGRYFSGSIAIRPGSRLAARAAERGPQPLESAPRNVPDPSGTFQYDGGPARPVPLPVPDPVTPTEPAPTTVPALQRVLFERSRSNAKYPALGDRPAKPASTDPLLVKRAAP